MTEYIYTDHKIEEVIFTTKTDDILKADKLFQDLLGYIVKLLRSFTCMDFLSKRSNNVSKHNYIGCEIVFKETIGHGGTD